MTCYRCAPQSEKQVSTHYQHRFKHEQFRNYSNELFRVQRCMLSTHEPVNGTISTTNLPPHACRIVTLLRTVPAVIHSLPPTSLTIGYMNSWLQRSLFRRIPWADSISALRYEITKPKIRYTSKCVTRGDDYCLIDRNRTKPI